MVGSAGMDEGLAVGLLHRVEVIDPHRSLAYAAEMVERQIFEPLYRRADGRLIPQLLKADFTLVDDAYQAELKDTAVWSDGTPMSGSEVCESLRRSGQLASAQLRADAAQIRISCSSPLSALRETLASPASALAKPATGSFADASARASLLGSGPYMVCEDDPSDELRLVRNPHHVGPQAPICVLTFRDYQSERELGEAVAKGLVDFTMALSPKELPTGSFVRTNYLPTPSTALLWMNIERIPDPRLRKAIASSIDRVRLRNLSYPGAQGLSAKGSLPVSLGQSPDQVLHDPQLARTLLAEEGVAPNQPLHLLLIWGPRPYLPDPLASGEEIVRQLGLAGIRVTVSQTTGPENYAQTMTAGEFDLALGGWYADDPSAWAYLSSLYASTSVPSGDISAGKSNFGRWRDPQCDAALQLLRDDPGNPAHIDAVGEIVREACPTVALHHGAATVALGRRIRGREFDSLGFPWFASFTLRR